MNIPRLLGVLFEIKAQGTTVHLDVRRYPPPTGPLLDTKFHLSRRPRVIAERDDRRVARARQRRGEGGEEEEGWRRVALVFRRRRVCRTHARLRLTLRRFRFLGPSPFFAIVSPLIRVPSNISRR